MTVTGNCVLEIPIVYGGRWMTRKLVEGEH